MRLPRTLALLSALLPSTPLLSQSPAPVRSPTNIVLLFSDDAGYADFGFQPDCAADCKGLTPHIDAIASAGARCSAAYVTGAVCSPSRAGLLTGRYQQRFGHETNLPQGYQGGLDLREHTLADRLHALGFVTALVGKWHLGYPPEYHPNRRGFDSFHGLLMGSRSYQPIAKVGAWRVIQENGERLPEVGYVTDRFGDAAVRFVAEHREQPFFLMVSFTATHGPLQPLPADVTALPTELPPRRRDNLGLLVGLDRAVGRVLDALAQHGLAERTLVVFTNDNGGQTLTGADNGPLRGKKGDVFEGGIRVPMCVRWPGHIAKATVIDDPVILLDLLPTFVAAGGGTAAPEWHLDGQDLGPRLCGAETSLRERALFWRTHGHAGPVAMRLGNNKLVWLRGAAAKAPMLFDLAADRSEQHDRAGDEPELVRQMQSAVAAWESELVEPRWGQQPDAPEPAAESPGDQPSRNPADAPGTPRPNGGK